MIALKPLSALHFRRLPGLLGGALLSFTLLAGDLGAMQQTRPDQLLWRNSRGQINTLIGTITENSLSKTAIEINGKATTRDSNDIVEIIFGDVPPAYVDAQKYFNLGDFENAAAKYSLAATDASAREVVRARARVRAAHALMRQGAVDGSAFAQARDEAQRYLAEHLESRDVPTVRELSARATWLAGDPAAAAELYRMLYNEAAGQTPSTGYSAAICFRAGLSAARCFLSGKDTLQARQIFTGLETALPRVLADLAEDAPERPEILAIQAQARLGEGYAMLVGGSVSQAKTFFQGQARSADPQDTAHRFAAHLGLAEALLAEGDHRAAQLEFAQVAAIDHTDRDRVARALVGMAECAVKLPDTNARTNARAWVQTVQEQYGDTPAAMKARELSQTL